MMKRTEILQGCFLLLISGLAFAQQKPETSRTAELKLRVTSISAGRASHHVAPAAIWLTPLPGTPALPFVSRDHYSLTQKNRTFIPHLQVIPVGSVVNFPNADPFFHNVFSLYEGKRFDLGLYEAGSTRSVLFSREGASYIFCNIHPNMSAVVLALSTPLYAIASDDGSFVLRGVPPGDYRMHLWMEGVPPATLDSLSRTLHFSSGPLDLGTIDVPLGRPESGQHKNKFGETYDSHSHSTY
jgi:plastocyanin